MRGLSLTQPFAQLVATGRKRIETRSWPTPYRGPVAIHAAKAMPEYAAEALYDDPFRSALNAHFGDDDPFTWQDRLPRGAIVAVGELVQCLPFKATSAAWARRAGVEGRLPTHEADFGDFAPGRYGFLLAGVRALPEPIPCRGMLGLWEVPADVVARIRATEGVVV